MSNVRFQIDPTEKMLIKRSLQKNGAGQKFLTSEIRRLADPYVPFATGMLKNTATVEPTRLTYIQPYARRQWYENKGNGKRGMMWVPRMWADRGKEIVSSVAKFCGGHT